MTHFHLLDSYILNLFPQNLDNLVILDVGCGYGEWGSLLRAKKGGRFYLLGIDIWRPHLERLSRAEVYDLIIQADASTLPLKNKSIDISLACEILEHLNKDAGYKLLEDLERISRKMIIISTPLNWPQSEIYGNPYEKHLSEWKPQELIHLGYKVKVINATWLPQKLKSLDKILRWLTKTPQAQLVIAYKCLTEIG